MKRQKQKGEEKKPVLLKGQKAKNNALYPKKEVKRVKKVEKFILPSAIYENAEDLHKALTGLSMKKMAWFALTGSKFSIKLGKGTHKVALSGRLSNLLGFTKHEEPYTIRKSEQAQYLPHWEGSTHSLYIYSSIVDYQVVGDVVAPLLRVVCPESSKLGQTVSEKYIKPYYLPVSSNYIDTIDVQIRTTSGHLFPFMSGSPVVVSLHFRPRGET